MVERLRRALGHIDFRIFLWLTPVVIAATVLGSLGQGSTAGPEEDTIGNWAELALKVGSDLRSGDEWRLIVPEEEVQPDRIKATLLQKGLAGLQETPHWYWGFDLGVLFFPDGSVIAGAVTSGTQVVVYEDMASGALGIASVGSSVGAGYESEMTWVAPLWPSVQPGEDLGYYLTRELSKRRIVAIARLVSVNDAARRETETARRGTVALPNKKSAGIKRDHYQSTTSHVEIAGMSLSSSGLVLKIACPSQYVGTVWSIYTYEAPACLGTNNGSGGGGPPPPGTNEGSTDAYCWCSTVTTNTIAGLASVWTPVFTNLLLTNQAFTTWTDPQPMGWDAQTNPVHRFYGLGHNANDSDLDGLSDAAEQFTTKTLTNAWDSDADGLSDGEEKSGGSNPTDPNDPPNVKGSIYYSGQQTNVLRVLAVSESNSWALAHSVNLWTPDPYHLVNLPASNYWLKAFRDLDGDGVFDAHEAFGLFTNNPILLTGQVIGADISLNDPDTDADSLPDWWELAQFTNLSATADGDPDGDEVQNIEEYAHHANPHSADTDGDELPDRWEIDRGYDPAVADPADADGDGLLNADELSTGTDPGLSDTDGDGICDGPLDPDGFGPVSAGLDTDPLHAAPAEVSQTPVVNPSDEPRVCLGEDALGRPIVAWIGQGQATSEVYVAKQFEDIPAAAGSWVKLESVWEGFGESALAGLTASTNGILGMDMAVDGNGWPVVAWAEVRGFYGVEIYLKRWTGTNWAGLGGSDTGDGLSDNAPSTVGRPSVGLRADGTPVVAYERDYGADRSIYVRAWTNGQWAGLSGSDTNQGLSGSGYYQRPQVLIPTGGAVIVAYECLPVSPAVFAVFLKGWNGAGWYPMPQGGNAYGAVENSGGSILMVDRVMTELGVNGAVQAAWSRLTSSPPYYGCWLKQFLYVGGQWNWYPYGGSGTGDGLPPGEASLTQPVRHALWRTASGGPYLVGAVWVQSDTKMYAARYWNSGDALTNWQALGNSLSGDGINTSGAVLGWPAVTDSRGLPVVACPVRSGASTNDPYYLQVFQYSVDTDQDGLGDRYELNHGTRVDLADTDSDGLTDRWEAVSGLDPLDNGSTNASNGAYADPDGDGDNNLVEQSHNTQALAWDSDGDGLADGTNGNVLASAHPGAVDLGQDGYVDGERDPAHGTDPLQFDSDGDGLVDGQDGQVSVTNYPAGVDLDSDGYVDGELAYGTDRNAFDTDGDGFGDGLEVRNGYDPNDPDDMSGDDDGDGLPNAWELEHDLDPHEASGDDGAWGDPDGDGVENRHELTAGIDPQDADTDNDTLNDGYEYRYGLDAGSAAGDQGGNGDADHDGLRNTNEMTQGTSPVTRDTDGDGVADRDELNDYQTDPTAPNAIFTVVSDTHSYILSGLTSNAAVIANTWGTGQPGIDGAEHIWKTDWPISHTEEQILIRDFHVDGKPTSSVLQVVCDNEGRVEMTGHTVWNKLGAWYAGTYCLTVATENVTTWVHAGIQNKLRVTGRNSYYGGCGGELPLTNTPVTENPAWVCYKLSMHMGSVTSRLDVAETTNEVDDYVCVGGTTLVNVVLSGPLGREVGVQFDVDPVGRADVSPRFATMRVGAPLTVKLTGITPSTSTDDTRLIATAGTQEIGREDLTVLMVDLDGDNEDDGDVDEEDDSVESSLPVIVACNSDTNTLIVRTIGQIPGTLKIKKSGQGKVILRRSDGSTVLGENAAESGDILSEVETSDLSLYLNGTLVGSTELVLEYANGSVMCADTVAVKVVQSDLVQRSGNVHLAALISETRTHTGIHWQQYVTDLYDPGIEQVSLSTFESLADGGPDKKRLRPKKSLFMARRVWAKIFDNMQGQSYALPSSAQPWNIFTFAPDYATANCNEFVNQQVRYAIGQVRGQLSKPSQVSAFESAWYDGSGVQPLVSPKHLVMFPGKSPTAGPVIFAMQTALNYRSKLVGATSQFHNDYEGHILVFWLNPNTSSRYNSGTGASASCPSCPTYPTAPWYVVPFLELWDEAHHDTITPDNFVGSSSFEEIPY